MIHEEEIDLSKRVPDPAAEIVSHFMRDIDEAAKDYTVPNEAFCAELLDVQTQIKKLQDREKKLKAVVKKLKDRGTFIHGGYSLKISERAGSKTLDKEALYDRLVAELGKEEADTYIAACTKQGEPTVTISVERINQTASGHGTVVGAGEGL